MPQSSAKLSIEQAYSSSYDYQSTKPLRWYFFWFELCICK